MLPSWLGIDCDNLENCVFKEKITPNILIYYLPEHFLESICKFHSGVFQYKNNYLSLVG